jgi:hypothetical protein
MLDYEERKQARIDRLSDLANKNRKLSNQKASTAHKMLDVIPMGQPILVGHHSEQRDRNYRNRIDNTFRKACELDKKADYYEQKAEAAINNNNISSDDPEAITKLKAELEQAEGLQSKMRAFNKCLRSKDNDGMLALGFSQSQIAKLSEPDFCGRLGFPDYALTNNNSKIRRIKSRIEYLEKLRGQTSKEVVIGEIKILDNIELNRIQIIFPDKPDDEIRGLLKRQGFRWCPSEGAWQRQRSNSAIYAARVIMDKLKADN